MSVPQVGLKYPKQLLLEAHLDNGRDDFNTIVQVSAHHVGTPEVHPLLARSVLKVKHAGMFEIPAGNSNDPNVLTQPRQSGFQAAKTSNQKVDFYAAL